tara:strand:+ start:4626 stop:5432 length:807 start_codon:yes stop_codon:yes gene_type:complete
MSDINPGNEPSNSSETAVSVDTNPVEQVVDQLNDEQVATNPSDEVSEVDGPTKPKYTKEEKAQHAYDKRISTLVAQRNELQAKLEQQEAAKNTVTPDSSLDELEAQRDELSDDEYYDQLTTLKSDMAVQTALNARTQEEAKKQEYIKQATTWNDRIKETGYSDYNEKVKAVESFIPQEAQSFMLHSSVGPKMAYALANDLDLIRDMNTMDSGRLSYTLYDLEKRISTPVEVTQAAKPTPSPSGKSAGVKDDGSTDSYMKRRFNRKYKK